MEKGFSRRSFLGMVAAGGAAVPMAGVGAEKTAEGGRRFPIALNTGTIRGYKLPLEQQIEQAIRAGYDGIEPWVEDIKRAAERPGLLEDLRKRCADAGFQVVGAIGFAAWAVNDAAAREKGLEQMKREMALVKRLGGMRIAASPAGVNGNGVKLDLDAAVERYAAVLKAGEAEGVVPQLEFWGRAANLSRLNQCLYVAGGTGHPDACVLGDVFHMYTGESPFEGLRFLSPSTARVFHVNDYPETPGRAEAQDRDRVWPGDGLAPYPRIMGIFREIGVFPWLSLELFNAEYWKAPVEATLKTGLEKVRCVSQ
ncbi:MAG: sugar phosphate isomerase/epimerase [Kiritimatiellae bacterium]|nr:sugar phosphate isomerase/epimerase [Kiritimatiellia bacterium]